jgi:hypothetical protein
MNKFGTEYNKTICRRMEMVEWMVKDMRREMEWFGNNGNSEFTDYDSNAIDFSMKKTDEAIECLHQSLLNLKMLLG